MRAEAASPEWLFRGRRQVSHSGLRPNERGSIVILGTEKFGARIKGGQVVGADVMCHSLCGYRDATAGLLSGDQLDGGILFDVPAKSHSAYISVASHFYWVVHDTIGTWNLTY